MNERINKIRIEAAEWMKTQGYPLEYRSNWEKQCDEKFAELIVQEAAAFVSGAAEVYNQAEQDACVRASKGLKNYFGVEE